MIQTYKKQPLPVVLPVPVSCPNIPRPVVSLDGVWQFKRAPFDLSLVGTPDFEGWAEVEVPDDISYRKGLGGEECGHYYYKRVFLVPKQAEGARVFLRFEGCNGFAKVYIDKNLAAEHCNGFITWNCEITDFVTPGQPAVLTVAVDDRADKVAAFNHGGLVHGVKLLVLPQSVITRLHCETSFDSDYNNAVLKVLFAADCAPSKDTEVRFSLFDPAGNEVLLNGAAVCLNQNGGKTICFTVPSPKKWDSEHPNLYTLRASLYAGGSLLETAQRAFGFRQIELRGNQMFVNGQEVKLRGVCRHEITPKNGRAFNKELAEQDIRLFKEANCNYIRTSHYPPSEYFLELCDRCGMYVEDEMGLAFIARSLDYTQRDPEQAQRYISHYTELAERDRSHPSVVIWSLCNESFGGMNFDLLNRFIHEDDPTRPTKFSYPMTMQEEHEPVDIWSIHYSNLSADLAEKLDNVSVGGAPGRDVPVLHDEYAHIPCYNRDEHKRDPYVRHFWGESIRRFWDKIWNTKGALGGAIWAGIDETDIFTGGNTALEWGIIDIWRRPKPEFFMTRKGYSPIRIEKEELDLQPGGLLFVEVENRFNHTDFNELHIRWSIGAHSGDIINFSLAPRQKGRLHVPASCVKPGEVLHLSFEGANGFVHDSFELPVSPAPRAVPALCGRAPKIEETPQSIRLAGRGFALEFSKKTGLVTSGSVNGRTLLKDGPYLNMPQVKLPAWQLKKITVSQQNNAAVVSVHGGYQDAVEAVFTITVDEEGLLYTDYQLLHVNVPMPSAEKIRVGVDAGGLDEIGVYYVADASLDTLRWERKSAWSAYPADHIGRTKGECTKSNGGADPAFGSAPAIPWSQDMKSCILYGKYDIPVKGTNDFRSTKEHIYTALLGSKAPGQAGAVEVLSDGSDSVRLELIPNPGCMADDRDPSVRYVGDWYAVEDKDGSYCGTEMWSSRKGDYAEFTFNGTGAAWIGSTDVLYGMAAVYVDSKLMDGAVNLRVNGVEFPGASAGFDKRYGIPLYSVTGLPKGEHTLKIEVTGEKADDSCGTYVTVDAFRLLDGGCENDDSKLIINRDFNFPRISWGNYKKPAITAEDGFCGRAVLRLKP